MELMEYLISVQEWIDGFLLKLNSDKTKFIIIGDKHAKFPVIQSSLSPAEEGKN